MTHREWLCIAQIKWAEQDGCCGTCKQKLLIGEKVALAHRIPDTKPNRKKYKQRVLDHILNRVLVCERQGNNCNDGVLLGAARPVEVSNLVERIGREL